MEKGKLVTAFKIAMNMASQSNHIGISDGDVTILAKMTGSKYINLTNRQTNGAWLKFDVIEEPIDIATYDELRSLAKQKKDEIVNGEIEYYIAECERQIKKYISTNINTLKQ